MELKIDYCSIDHGGQKMNLDNFIVNIFCETDDFMKKYFPERTFRSRGPMPQMADSEVYRQRNL